MYYNACCCTGFKTLTNVSPKIKLFWSNFQPSIGEPVPPPLAQQDQITRDQHFETTTGKAHDAKYPGLLYSNPIHKKAPGHWKVDYVKDLAEKVLECKNFSELFV